MPFKNPFFFLRHGQTDFNAARRCQGQMDSQLDATGRAQARRAALILRDQPVARIVASPLSRARHTAEAVAAENGLDIAFDDGLMEVNLGVHQGQPIGDWAPDFWTGDYDPPGGETFAQFADRVWAAMARAAALGPDTLIVAHGGLWLAALSFTRIEPTLRVMPNALPMRVTPAADHWRAAALDPDRAPAAALPD